MGWKKILAASIFPGLIIGSTGASFLGLSAGINRTLLTAAIVVSAALLLMMIERILPYADAWNRSHGDVTTDLLHTVLSTGVIPAAFQAVCYGWLTYGAVWLSQTANVRLWPEQWPLLAQFVLALITADLGAYWGHRWSHEVGFLWRLHATHHSAPRLYWLNAGRFHPLDNFLGYLMEVSPLILLGAGESVIVAYSVYTAVNGMLRHCNIDLRTGPLNRVFSTADLHRWHHSRALVEANANYAPNLMLWDTLFGTRLFLKDRQPSTDIGLAEMPRFPSDYFGQLTSPFRWRALTD